MNLKKTLEHFFENYNHEINIEKLLSKMNLRETEYEQLENAIYELELEGKIYGDNYGNYLHVPKEFYLSHGKIQLSSKKNYYINMEKGKIIIIPFEFLNGAEKGDTVFVESKKTSKHDKQLIGKVVRVVTKPTLDKKNYLCKCNVKKDYNKGNFYVHFNNKNIIIPDNYLNGAYMNDLVTIQVISSENNLYGKVIEVIQRYQQEHVLEYKKIDGNLEWTPYDMPSYKVTIKMPSNERFIEGDCVVAKICEDNEYIYIKKIEAKNKLERSITSLCYQYGFNPEFSKKVFNELLNYKDNISEEDLKERKDLRSLTTITIDGATAKDLDDAISLEKIDDKYLLYIHIADVSNYVKPGSALFNDAKERTTSLYLADSVIPMLPPELSKGLCSLNPNEDKLTKTCSVLIDSNGNILDFNVYRSVIKSNMKMSYEKVNDLLAGRNLEEMSEYIPFFKLLHEMNIVANILQRRRLERGFICFQSKELEFDINDNGAVENVYNRVTGPAQQIVENFMLLANEIIASYAYHMQIPFAYRNHEGISIDQLAKLKGCLKNAGHVINKISYNENPKLIQKILFTIGEGKTQEEMTYLSELILRCMNRAYYSSDNFGHYGLALEQYATFTSPIRRLPDLLNHLALDCVMDGDMNKLELYDKQYSKLCTRCTEKQLQAENLEKAVNYCLLKDYLGKYMGEVLIAKIVFIANDLVGVVFNNTMYGSIPIHKKNVVQNKLVINQKIYQLGDTIPVKIDRIKEDSEDILLSIVKDYEKNKQKVYVKEDENDKYKRK